MPLDLAGALAQAAVSDRQWQRWTMEDGKIEAVARALCAFEGKDPDLKTRLPGGRVGFQSRIAPEALDGPPLWESYRAEAEKFVVVAEALQPFFKREARW